MTDYILEPEPREPLQAPHQVIQLMLVTGGLVAVDDALIGHTVDDRQCFLQGCHCRVLVLVLGGVDDLTHGTAQQGPFAGISLPSFLTLTGAFFG